MFPLTGEHPEYGQWPYRLRTLDTVIHAEENAIAKLARSHESGDGAAMFITHAPCQQCAKMILQSGIAEVWYAQQYRNDFGVNYLNSHGVPCQQYKESNNANNPS
jgi:deoxycytidylate deaminase